jgi:hypothetical protein
MDTALDGLKKMIIKAEKTCQSRELTLSRS